MRSPVGAPHGRLRVLGLPQSLSTRLYDGLRGSSTGLVALALATGLAAGVGAIVFRELIAGFTLAFTGTPDYSAAGRAAYPLLPWLGPWFIVAVPAIGGLLYGPLIQRFAPEARGHGVPEVMFAVSQEGGRIRPRVAIVKSLASAICLGAGGSVGREGPIVQIGSAVGSTIGQVLRLSENNLRLLVACGAAGGISATFNTPIAGVFFALELILRDYEVRSFGVVVLASVVADVISRAAFGNTSFLPLPNFQITSVAEYPMYVVLGVLAAVAGLVFVRGLYGAEDLVDRLWGGRPEWLRPVVGGLVLGLLLLALPELYGVGYPALEGAVHGGFALELVAILCVAKIAATSLTIAIGGSGGVFAPSLYIGGMLGTAFGVVMGQLTPGLVGPPGAYALVGMGAVFAAAARAPITSVLIIFELTGDYQIILPLMLAVALAAGISSVVTGDTIYTLKLRRRGIDVSRGRAANVMELITVDVAMRPVPVAVPASATITEFVDRFVGEGREALPVVDDAGAYRGVVTAQEVEGSMRENALDATAGSLALQLPALPGDASLEQALTLLVRQEVSGLPVVTREGQHVIGWLTHRDILRAYAARLGHEVAVAEGGSAPDMSPEDVPGRLRDYRIADLEIRSGAAIVGRRIGDVAWPAFSLPIAIRRDERSFRPGPATIVQAGDRLTVLVPYDLLDRLDDLVAALTTTAPGSATGRDTGHVEEPAPGDAEAGPPDDHDGTAPGP